MISRIKNRRNKAYVEAQLERAYATHFVTLSEAIFSVGD